VAGDTVEVAADIWKDGHELRHFVLMLYLRANPPCHR